MHTAQLTSLTETEKRLHIDVYYLRSQTRHVCFPIIFNNTNRGPAAATEVDTVSTF